MDTVYSMLAMKNGAAGKPTDIRYAPMNVLNALGSLHKAVFIPEAIPRSRSSTKPIIMDCDRGLAMFIRKARIVYVELEIM